MVESRQNILCVSGLDPSGGAGVQADIEAIAAAGAHALPVVTALTVQDTCNVQSSEAVAAPLLARQIDALIADCRIAAVKIGLLGGVAQLDVLVPRIAALNVPVVCDPVLRAGGGTDLASAELIASLRERLLPVVTVLTPNAGEARRLVPAAHDPAGAAAALLADGCANILITGGDEPGDDVINTWYARQGEPRAYRWPRLPETFHGAGCTLAAALAARLARGDGIASAIEDAQRWTQMTLQRAYAAGRGRRLPWRINCG
jgi:hydroxymethylpyrimidine/phosphomethylpyrimidine kinase